MNNYLFIIIYFDKLNYIMKKIKKFKNYLQFYSSFFITYSYNLLSYMLIQIVINLNINILTFINTKISTISTKRFVAY